MARINRLKKNRSGQRGAALVEGALTFPILCLFFSFMASFYHLHRESYVVMNEARRQAWDKASKGCKSGSGGGSQDTGSPNLGSGAGAAGKTGQASVVTGIIVYAKGYSKGTSDAAPFKAYAGKKSMEWSHYVTCNEDVNPGADKLSQMVGFAKSFGSGLL